MSTVSFWIFFFTNVFRIFVNIRFLAVFLEKNTGSRSRYIRFLTMAVCFTVTGAGYLVFRDRNINILTNVIGLLLMTITFEGSMKKRLLAVSIIYFFNMICDVIVVISAPKVYGIRPEIYELLGTMTVLLITVCEILMEKTASIRKKVSFVSPYWYLMLVTPLLSMVMIHCWICADAKERMIIVTGGTGLLIINLLSFFLYGAMEEAYLNYADSQIQIHTYERYKDQLDIIMESQNQVCSLKHDMKHHLRELLAMAGQQKTPEMMDYLERMNQLIDNPNEYVYSGNKEIDSNLNYLLKGARQRLKEVSVKLAIPERESMSSFDMNIILSNILENAITAAEQTEEKYLKLYMEEKQGLLYITVENSYNGIVNERDGSLFTTKKNSSCHGYGLKSVKGIVKKYDGTIEIHHTESRFYVDIMLYLSGHGEETG